MNQFETTDLESECLFVSVDQRNNKYIQSIVWYHVLVRQRIDQEKRALSQAIAE